MFLGVFFYLRNLEKKNYNNNKKSNKTKKFDIPKSIEINSYKLKYRILKNAVGKSAGPALPMPRAGDLYIMASFVADLTLCMIYSNYMSVLGNVWVSTRWLGY